MNDSPGDTGEEGTRLARQSRAWSGVQVTSETWQLPEAPVLHAFPPQAAICLATVLESRGGIPQPRLSARHPERRVFGPGVVHLVSEGMPLWRFSTSVTFVQDASLVFHPNDVEPMLGETFDPSRLELPLLGHRDERLFEIIRLLVSATDQFGVAAGLYGDGLMCSAMSLLFAKKTMGDERIHGLAPWQLSQAMELLDERLPDRVSISELATLTNLSPSHFGRAFKKSTGVSPYQWQLRRRIEQAMGQLRDPRFTLVRIATDAGFSEQAHFTRAFRRVTGVPPGQWRRRFHDDVD